MFEKENKDVRMFKDVDNFLSSMFQIVLLAPGPMQATRPRCVLLGTPCRDLLSLFIPRYWSLLLFNQVCCCSVVPVQTLEHSSVLNVWVLYTHLRMHACAHTQAGAHVRTPSDILPRLDGLHVHMQATCATQVTNSAFCLGPAHLQRMMKFARVRIAAKDGGKDGKYFYTELGPSLFQHTYVCTPACRHVHMFTQTSTLKHNRRT